MAEKRTEAARQESVDKVVVDDLDNIATPGMIMLSGEVRIEVTGPSSSLRATQDYLQGGDSPLERLCHDIAHQVRRCIDCQF